MKIVIHGGFFSESSQSDETKGKKQAALKDIIKKGYEYLKTHTALETVVYTSSLLEDCPLFNAGIGSQIQRDGKIRMSASVMDGSTMKFGGVINVENIQNPVLLSKTLLEEDDRILSGSGAKAFADDLGVPDYSTQTEDRRIEFEEKRKASKTGTVGCVALDGNGRLAAATSTGGKGFEIPGRVSDSASTAGNYANRYCAVSCTGIGEDIISASLASTIVTRVRDGMSINEAFSKAFGDLSEFGGFAGAIGVDATGKMCWMESHPKIVFAAFDGAHLDLFH